MSGRFGGGPKCPRCGKTVYMAEEVMVGGHKWHKNCFKCYDCKKSLDSMSMEMYESNFYCLPCYRKYYKTDRPVEQGGKYVKGAEPTSLGSGSSKCPKCGKSVFMAEEQVAAGQKFHKMCFKCTDCNKMLDSHTVANHEFDLYCKACHTKKFGLKGYGYGGGAGTLASETFLEQTDQGLSTSHLTSGGGSYSASQVAPSGSSSSKFGGTDKCPRCGHSVYAAEKIVGAGSSWHKACFNCANCGKKLDSTTVSDRDGEIYCKGCYGKSYGPKGVGFGQGAGALTMT